jgi:predicted lipoprotein with Yx(FWY)xxD motif
MGLKSLLALAAALTLAGSLAACGSSNDNSKSTSSSTQSSSATGTKVTLTSNKLGKILVGPNGHTVYLFLKDKTPNTSTCFGACAKVWTPVPTTGAPQAGPGIQTSLLGVTKRKDGITQVTFNGHPIYYYDDDKKAGTTEGQNKDEFGAEWYVLSAQGNKLE